MQNINIEKLSEENFVPPNIYTYPPRKTFVNKNTYSCVNNVWKASENKELGLYIHIPFWKYKCAYCNLYAFEICDMSENDLLIDKYIQALSNQLRFHSSVFSNFKISSIHFGGGDPLLLGSKLFESIIITLDEIIPRWKKTVEEFSVESTPYSVIALKKNELKKIVNFGVNRINIGAPPLKCDNEEIKRVYDEALTFNAIRVLRENGVEHISVDVMMGMMNESKEDWINSIKNIALLKPNTISFLPLTIRYDSSYGKTHNIKLKTSTKYYEWYDLGRKVLLNQNYYQQTNIRFVNDYGGNKQEDLHYSLGSIIGIGAGARSYNDVVDYLIESPKNGLEGVKEYIEAINNNSINEIIKYSFIFNEEEKIRQYLILNYNGFSLDKILSLKDKNFSNDILNFIAYLMRKGYLFYDKKYYFTDTGIKYHDLIALCFYSDTAKMSDPALWEDIKYN